MPTAVQTDAELVDKTLAGNRDAFGQIVSRYQSLLCSLVYSATGSLNQSEDLAQDIFVVAWKQLADLREPAKLRSWLCGIARNLINNTLRQQGREPAHAAGSLDELHESPAPEPWPGEQAISKEEQAILWRSLERIPQNYREPLVLFYREHQSVERVAQALELSEDAVHQRLSRGRKLLHEEVLAFVEGALAKTNPGQAFTIAVLAALPVTLTTSAKAATLGAAAAKGSLAAKAAASAGLFSAILSPLLSFVGPWIQYLLWLKAAGSEPERLFIKRYVRNIGLAMLLFVVGFSAVAFGGMRLLHTHTILYAATLTAVGVSYVLAIVKIASSSVPVLLKFQKERAARENATSAQPVWKEYRSRLELFGLPLIHIRSNRVGDPRSPVKAWIAGGGYAMGVIFAFGGVAIAPISFGGVAIGLLSWGGLALGAVAFGGFALGGWSVGGFAIGWQAFGGCAIALNAAQGGLAIARDFAFGGAAQAAQTEPKIAAQFFKGSFFFRHMEILSRYFVWLNLLWLLPLFVWWRTQVKRAKRN